jgi:hypothetical protein
MKRATVQPAPLPSNRGAVPAPGDSAPGAAGHDEWLLDESLGETFPASDPISPGVASNPEKKKGPQRGDP